MNTLFGEGLHVSATYEEQYENFEERFILLQLLPFRNSDPRSNSRRSPTTVRDCLFIASLSFLVDSGRIAPARARHFFVSIFVRTEVCMYLRIDYNNVQQFQFAIFKICTVANGDTSVLRGATSCEV